jgi:tetratricopeptide (TPR) repeat protein
VNGENATSTIETDERSPEGQQAETGNNWSSTQAYGLAILCLVLGLGLGFLLRGSASHPLPDPHAGHDHAAAPTEARASVTPEQLKHMAEKAVEPLKQQLNQNPNDAKLLADIGNRYYVGHQFDTAIEYYTKSLAVKADPNVLVQLANAQHYSGASDKAIATLNRALEIDPKFANALFNLGMLKWKTDGDAAGAINAWQQLLKTNPNHPNRAKVEEMIERVKQQSAAK